MSLNRNSEVGVIGAGSFGTAIANLLAENQKVYIFSRRKEAVKEINEQRLHRNYAIHENVTAVDDREFICEKCSLIFPMVAAINFSEMIDAFAPYLGPHHVLIHGTKGLNLIAKEEAPEKISREEIQTMTEVILARSNVLRVGCMSGPNLAAELAEKKPAATVIASRFDEVIELGKAALRSQRFRVYGSHDVLGVELAGVLKNIMALSSGMHAGLELGENARAMLLTRGLNEMVRLGQKMGSNASAFFGIAGIGDLIATCSSSKSRNFTVGYRLAKGQELDFILEDMNDTAEGINTAKVARLLARNYEMELPIMQAVYEILYEGKSIDQSIRELMLHPFDHDGEFGL